MHTFQDPLQHAVTLHPGRTSLVCGDVRHDFATTFDRCRRLAAGLRSLGIGHGDRVAIVGPNCHRYIESYLALPAAGFVIVPLNARHTDHELGYAATDARARILLTDRAPSTFDDQFEHVVRFGDEYEALIASVEPEVFLDDVGEADLAGLFYTGGTTGTAKGVMLTHRNLLANTWSLFQWTRLNADDRWLVVAPLFHAAGSLAILGSVWLGATQVVLPGFDPVTTIDAIERERITITLLVPTMLAAATDEQMNRPRNVASLRQLSHGASPVSSSTLRRAVDAFPGTEFVHLYGATETAPIVTALTNEQLLLDSPLAASCGTPIVGVRVAIVGSAGEQVGSGGIGEVAVRGANVMRGYWNKPEETAAAMSDGWYRTGDLGRLDETGHLFLIDRAKDMIVSGGENVYSVEVENALASHPAVSEVAVVGIPNEKWGEAVHAVVVLRDRVDVETLRAHCRTLVADYKVPKSISISDVPLPKSGAGKILKRDLREPYWEGHDTRIG